VTGVAIFPQANGQTEIAAEKLVGALRTLNTFEYVYRDENGRFANREELLAILRQKGVLSKAAIDFENPNHTNWKSLPAEMGALPDYAEAGIRHERQKYMVQNSGFQ